MGACMCPSVCPCSFHAFPKNPSDLMDAFTVGQVPKLPLTFGHLSLILHCFLDTNCASSFLIFLINFSCHFLSPDWSMHFLTNRSMDLPLTWLVDSLWHSSGLINCWLHCRITTVSWPLIC